MNRIQSLIDKLHKTHSLNLEEYREVIEGLSPENAQFALERADKERRKFYGNKIFLRGLIEIGNVCRNNCYYCGIRKDNKNCQRYILSPDEILDCCKEGYKLGFHTFVLQGGENTGFSADKMCSIISKIRKTYPDCAITLSIGEYEKEDYFKMKESGADRFLLRHETADKDHYQKLHPKEMSFDHRINCLYALKEAGFQTGCGFMVGSPFQTSSTLAKDLKFIEEFQPEMCGIGPFIPQKDTPFKDYTSGTESLTTYLLSLIRLIKPNVLLPSTTALNTISPSGRVNGILAGANVIMPNLSPFNARKNYTLYDKKLYTDEESAQNLIKLKEHMKEIGFEVVMTRGDIVSQ